MNVGYLITRAARLYSERTAVVYGDVRRTFAEVDECSNRLANSLLALGLRKGDRLAVVMHNCAEYVELEFAFAKAGLCTVPLNSRLLVKDHLFMIRDSGATALVCGPSFTSDFLAARAEMPGVRHIITLGQTEPGLVSYADLLAAGAPTVPPQMYDVTLDDLNNIMYTSGTTGRPKGVFHTQRVKWTVTMNMLTEFMPQTDDKLLHVAPLTHGTGFFVLPWFMRGACSVVMDGFDPRAACETIEREKVTVFKLVPTVLIKLLALPDLDRYDLGTLRTIIYGASPMPVDKLREAIKRFGQILVQLYGQTEALCTITLLPKEDHVVDGTLEQTRRLASAGRPFSNVAVRVVTDEGRDAEPGEVGEVCIRGDHVMGGYWNLPEETAATLVDGWVHSRDLATVDEKGYIYLVDRKSDMIISGGFNIYPREVEEVLHSHPAVMEVAVFGVPDETWGEAVKAAVVLRSGASVSAVDLVAFCSEHLSGFKKPKSIDFLPELPKNAYGKIQKNALREPYWKGLGRRVN